MIANEATIHQGPNDGDKRKNRSQDNLFSLYCNNLIFYKFVFLARCKFFIFVLEM